MTKMDYDTITLQGALAKDNDALRAVEFEIVMTRQVQGYIKRNLQRSVSETETLQDFASSASLKALMMKVDTIKDKKMQMHVEISVSFADLHHSIALLVTQCNTKNFRQHVHWPECFVSEWVSLSSNDNTSINKIVVENAIHN